jgi:phosphoglycerate dehydrogenase-like enzyme
MQNLNAVLESKDIVASTKKDQAYCLELSNRTVGIIGMESLGQSVAMILRDLGVTEIVYYDFEAVPRATDPDINAKFVGQNEILSRSDILFVCSQQDGEKDDLVFFNMDAFNKMKPSVLLIDVTKKFPGSFGDLYEALRSGKIAAAGLDVREYDDIPNRHPLDMLENCFYLPYRECYKWDGRKTCAQQLAGAILKTLQEIDFSQKKPMPRRCSKNELTQIPEVPI